jgi:hypothetical protein
MDEAEDEEDEQTAEFLVQRQSQHGVKVPKQKASKHTTAGKKAAKK